MSKKEMHPDVRIQLIADGFHFHTPPRILGYGGSCVVEEADVSLPGSAGSIARAVKVPDIHHPIDPSANPSLVNKELSALDIIRELPTHKCLVALIDYRRIAVNDSGITREYLVTTWQKAGKNLQHLGVLGVDELLRHIESVAEAVDFLHRLPQPVIHRDIKPNNIFVTDSDQQARLGDLGLAKLLSPDEASSLAVQHVFAAPELQVKRMAKASRRSDLYSLAASYVCLRTRDKKLRRIPITVSDMMSAGMGSDESKIVASALQEDPAKRPSNGAVAWVQELAAAISADPSQDTRFPTIDTTTIQSEYEPVHEKTEPALEIWKAKLSSLRSALAIETDAAVKFKLQHEIDEATSQIRELGG